MSFPIQIKHQVIPGVVQLTLNDKRWYAVEQKDGSYLYYPSVTWILDVYPKGIGFHKWLASLPDYETGRQMLNAAGDRGSKVHWGISQLVKNETIHLSDIPYGYSEPFTGEEWEFLMSFVSWFKIFRPLSFMVEQPVISEKHGYAGTADLVCVVDEGLLLSFNPRSKKAPVKSGKQVTCLFDWKTSRNIYDSHKLQVYAYTEPLKVDYVGILRLGASNKNGFEFWISKVDSKERPDYFGKFLSCFEIWKHEHGNARPITIHAPEELSLLTENEDVFAKGYDSPDSNGFTGEDHDGNVE